MLLLTPGVSADTLDKIISEAEAGNAQSQLILGRLYVKGDRVKMDNAEALKWYRKAAVQGNAMAQTQVAIMYQDGKGVKADPVEAVNWYRKAAEQGYAIAQYALGSCY